MALTPESLISLITQSRGVAGLWAHAEGVVLGAGSNARQRRARHQARDPEAAAACGEWQHLRVADRDGSKQGQGQVRACGGPREDSDGRSESKPVSESFMSRSRLTRGGHVRAILVRRAEGVRRKRGRRPGRTCPHPGRGPFRRSQSNCSQPSRQPANPRDPSAPWPWALSSRHSPS